MSKRLKLNVLVVRHDASDTPSVIFHQIEVIRNVILDHLPWDDDNYQTFQQFASKKYCKTRLHIPKEDTVTIFQKHVESDPEQGNGLEYLVFLFCGLKALFGEAFYRFILNGPWFTATKRQIDVHTPHGILTLNDHFHFSMRFPQPVNIVGVFEPDTNKFIESHEVLKNQVANIKYISLVENNHWHLCQGLDVCMNEKWKACLHSVSLEASEFPEFKTSTFPRHVHYLSYICRGQCSLILDHESSSQLTHLQFEGPMYDSSLCNLTCSMSACQFKSMGIFSDDVEIKVDILKQFPPHLQQEEMNFIRRCKKSSCLQFDELSEKTTFARFHMGQGNLKVMFQGDCYTFQLDTQENCCHLKEFELKDDPETDEAVEIKTSEIPSTWERFVIYPQACVTIMMDHFCPGLLAFEVKDINQTILKSSLTWQAIPTSLEQITICHAACKEDIIQLFPFLFDNTDSDRLAYKKAGFEILNFSEEDRRLIDFTEIVRQFNLRFFLDIDRLPSFSCKCVHPQ